MKKQSNLQRLLNYAEKRKVLAYLSWVLSGASALVALVPFWYIWRILNEVIEALELKDIEAVHGRAEDFARDKEYRAAYDICVSRAVANLSTLSEYCLPFVKMGGCFVSYKSGECESEVADAKSAIYLLGGKLNKIEQFGYSDNHRSFVIIDKVMNTSNKYPRKAGLPSKKPL